MTVMEAKISLGKHTLATTTFNSDQMKLTLNFFSTAYGDHELIGYFLSIQPLKHLS